LQGDWEPIAVGTLLVGLLGLVYKVYVDSRARAVAAKAEQAEARAAQKVTDAKLDGIRDDVREMRDTVRDVADRQAVDRGEIADVRAELSAQKAEMVAHDRRISELEHRGHSLVGGTD